MLGASISILNGKRHECRDMARVGNSQEVEYYMTYLTPSTIEGYAEKRRIRERGANKK